MTWLGVYATATPGVIAADNATARFDPDNEPQPDAQALLDGDGAPRAGGPCLPAPKRTLTRPSHANCTSGAEPMGEGMDALGWATTRACP